ncbi:hypothetical protein FACS189431_3040 [Alphaproteobacteria bacterium]|nr:hypothetical protein FACS189431_3040 [Alphaproteobacteria bacterium]
MKYKKEFLGDLTTALERHKIEVEPIVEYYDELIDERVKSGKTTEKTVVNKLGAIDDIVREVVADEKIERAVNKPTVSNGVKALLACLGVLSLPITLPLVVVLLCLIFTVIIVLFSLIVTAGAVIIGLVLALVVLFVSVIKGDIGFEILLFCMGVALVIIPLAFESIRGLAYLTRAFVGWLVGLLKRKKNSKKGEQI